MASTSIDVEKYTTALLAAREDIRDFINDTNTNPIMLRTAWHDAGSFSGANGSIRFEKEMAHEGNAGLAKVIKFLEPIKKKHSILSWADIIQMAGATAVELAGGPKIPMRYGRIDGTEPASQEVLPGALPPFKEGGPAQHLRAVFGRMGLGDREIVALSGAHTLGRAFKERSGTVEQGYGSGTKYTMPPSCPRFDGQAGFGMAGGMSWTQNWLTFDNSYFTHARPVGHGGAGKDMKDELLWLPTDAVLSTDPSFSKYFKLYAASQDAFFQDYAEAHRRLSEVGSKWATVGGIMLPEFPKSRL
jgi:L-ascorbate peroxidase